MATVAPTRRAAFLSALADWLPGRTFTLLYRGSRDGMTPLAFHSLCDGKGPTLVLIRCDKGFVFGGYAGASWVTAGDHDEDCDYFGGWNVASPDAFLLSVVGPYSSRPVKFPVLPEKAHEALYNVEGCGPAFTIGLVVCSVGMSPTAVFGDWSNCSVGDGGYENVLGKGNESLTGAHHFTPTEMEVFAVARL
ncbi:MAG: TLD domain-containing protein [Terracidiphilus sp.]|nr:TLD domain-containing protein [Terracidiphilus sp.]